MDYVSNVMYNFAKHVHHLILILVLLVLLDGLFLEENVPYLVLIQTVKHVQVVVLLVLLVNLTILLTPQMDVLFAMISLIV